jgi:type IV secretion system protein VirB11
MSYLHNAPEPVRRVGETTLRKLLGEMTEPLADPLVTEVLVNQPHEFWVEREGIWSRHPAPSLNFETLDAIGILCASMAGQELDAAHPFHSGNLPDGQRIQICRPPATDQGIVTLTIRKPAVVSRTLDDPDMDALFANTNRGVTKRAQSDAELLKLFQAREWRDFLRLAVRSRKTIGTCGPTGSGKTDLLRRLIYDVPKHERIVTIEDAAEYGKLHQPNRVALYYEAGSPVRSAENCVMASLRMRPDRIWLQEVRGGEAYAFLRALAAGHPGGATSWHAEEGEAFDALELMVKQHPAGATLPDSKVRSLLRTYMDIIIWCQKDGNVFTAPQVWFKAVEE